MKEKNKIDYRKSSQELVNRIQTVPNNEQPTNGFCQKKYYLYDKLVYQSKTLKYADKNLLGKEK